VLYKWHAKLAGPLEVNGHARSDGWREIPIDGAALEALDPWITGGRHAQLAGDGEGAAWLAGRVAPKQVRKTPSDLDLRTKSMAWTTDRIGVMPALRLIGADVPKHWTFAQAYRQAHGGSRSNAGRCPCDAL
jgi:hypothetical protein